MIETLEPSPNETSISDFLRTVEAGQDIKDALVEWQKKNTGRLKVEALRKNLFAEEPQVERHSSGSLQATAVMRAIETEKNAAKKRKLRPIHLLPTCEGYTVLTPVIQFKQDGYHAVIERGRAFSLKMTDVEASTESLIEVASKRCFELRGQWPTCILIKTERLFLLDQEVYERGYCVAEDEIEQETIIPFDCAEPMADYDVKVVISKEGDDEWINDRKVS
jgi:hypothetical protein